MLTASTVFTLVRHKMFPLNHSINQNFNPNIVKKNKQAMNSTSDHLNINHRICQAGDKATINAITNAVKTKSQFC